MVPVKLELFFVAGLDSFLEIQNWKSPEELLDLCNFIVVSRPANSFEHLHDALPERFHERIVDRRSGADSGAEGDAGERAGLSIFLSDDVLVDVSSTDIRGRVRDGRSVRYRVTPEVERYMVTHTLYRQAARREAVS